VAADAPAKPKAPGLGDPGQLQKITVDTGRDKDGVVQLAGRDAVQQIVVTGNYSSGQERDLTRTAKYTATPDGIVSVDATGYVSPVSEGEATIRISAAPGVEGQVKVKVTNLVNDTPVNFPNQITPLFTKYSCNGGGCHGKSGGQNGFRLSLLGFEPTEDFEWLVRKGVVAAFSPPRPTRACCCSRPVLGCRTAADNELNMTRPLIG